MSNILVSRADLGESERNRERRTKPRSRRRWFLADPSLFSSSCGETPHHVPEARAAAEGCQTGSRCMSYCPCIPSCPSLEKQGTCRNRSLHSKHSTGLLSLKRVSRARAAPPRFLCCNLQDGSCGLHGIANLAKLLGFGPRVGHCWACDHLPDRHGGRFRVPVKWPRARLERSWEGTRQWPASSQSW
jgi:hypothetical protein